MTVQADFWHLVGLLLGFLSLCGVALGIVFKLTLSHLDKRFDAQEVTRATAEKVLADRMDALESVNRDETLQWQRVEREMLKFQAELPMRYVMRDDYIRGQTVIEAKLDAVASKLESAQLRGMIGGGQA